jgi:hypothetical protein
MQANKMKIEEFGAMLLSTKDLDPVYVALVNSGWDSEKIKRWMVAYWCLYHCGVSCHISEFEGKEFWDKLMEAAKNETASPIGERWSRGAERRHWRGQQAVSSAQELMDKYERPEQMVDYIAGEGGTFAEISKRAQTHRGFGDWIGFKIADMCERVLGKPVAFDNAAVFMFKDPEKAAWMLWAERNPEIANNPHATPKREVVLNGVADYLMNHFAGYTAPPLHDRPVNIQEVETILCKWKSHMNGHYPAVKDIREIRHGLEDWFSASVSAQQLYAAMPTGESS